MADGFDERNVLGIANATRPDREFGDLLSLAPPPADRGPDNFNDLLNLAPNTASTNLKASTTTNPDSYARTRELSNALGAPVEVVEGAEEEAERIRVDAQFENLAVTAPATATFFEDPENAKLAHDDVNNLTTLELFISQSLAPETTERVIAGFERGELTTRLGRRALQTVEQRGLEALEEDTQVALIQQRLQALGEDTEGFVSALAGASEFFGQTYERVQDPRLPLMMTAGGAVGAAAGAAGGPLAFITVPAGTGGGLASGFIAQQIMAMGEIEAGLALVEMQQEGVDPNVAWPVALGVGVVNAGLETLGGASFLRPLTEAGKRAFREGLRGVVRNPRFREAAANFAINYSKNVGTEVATEVAQEIVTMAAVQLGKEITEEGTGELTPEGWEERLVDTAIKVLKTTAILASPGATAAFVMDVRKNRTAEQDAETLDQAATIIQQGQLAQRAPDKVGEHARNVFDKQNVSEVYVPVAELDRAAAETGRPQEFLGDLGVLDQMDDARAFDGDIRIDVASYTQHVLTDPDRQSSLRDHVKIDPDGVTVAQSQETLSTAEEATVEAAEAAVVTDAATRPDQPLSPETEATVGLAEHELGVRALFQTGNDAALGEQGFKKYIQAYQEMREGSRIRKERQRLKRLERQTTEQYQQERAVVQQEVEASLSQEPLYQAFLSLSGPQRLDRAETLELLQGDREALNRLPRIGGQRITAPRGEQGISPSILADIYGFEGGDVLLYNFLDNPTFEDAVTQRTDALMEERFPTLLDERARLREALVAVQRTTDFGSILNFELNQMRKARKQGALKPHLIRARAKQIVGRYKISDIKPGRFEAVQRREARRASKALRAGDLDTAIQAKTNQSLAHEITRETYAVQREVARGNTYMRKFTRRRRPKRSTLPVDYLTSIQDILAGYQFGPHLSDRKRKDLEDWVKRKQEAGVAFEVPRRLLEADGTVNYQDMTLFQWRELNNTVRDIEKQGREENKLRREGEKNQLDQVANTIAARVEASLGIRTRPQAADVQEVTEISRIDTTLERMRELGRSGVISVYSILLNADSMLRRVDNWEELGTAYSYIKGGIDQAYTEGYQPGQKGYKPRMEEAAVELQKLYNTYTKTERFNMARQIDIPGVRTRLTRGQRISVLLNMGNADNIRALTDAKDENGVSQFTIEELQAIRNTAPKKDLDFAQAVWDYMDSFWSEIQETTKRRHNRDPQRVEPLAFDTPHGTYRGGYYPLRYDSSRSVVEGNVTLEEARDRMMFGGFIGSHTQHGHTKERRYSGERPVLLDPFIINTHVQEVIYDLEMGDAVTDSYKVLHHPSVKGAFRNAGYIDTWHALDTWQSDVITGEIYRSHILERIFRRIRTGTTVSALGFNVAVGALQGLGLAQSAVLIGKRYMAEAAWLIVSSPLRTGSITAPYDLLQEVTNSSGLMREREQNANAAIVDAQRGLRESVVGRFTPGDTAKYVGNAFFLFITKAQRLVDFITWVAAKRKGLDLFDGDPIRSNQYADRMVVRSQGSGNPHERTAVERGTLTKDMRQTELVRMFGLFLNFFAAKLNVAYERTGRTNFRNPVQAANWATDMALLYFFEGFVIAAISALASEDDEDDGFTALAGTTAYEGMKTFMAGIPVVREITGRAEGFATGGTIGSFVDRLVKAGEQIGQGEADVAAFTSVNAVLGTLFQYPTSQLNKTLRAIDREEQGYDVEWWQYLFGPSYED